jgi:abortive infection bacteriophage resistance protein
MTVDYTKPPLTYAQQVALLQSRGLVVNNTDDAVKFLQHVNYYRFSAYCIPFQKIRDVFLPGTSFETVVGLYRLDEELRNAFLTMLSPIEVFLRTRIVYELSHGWGAFAHYEPANFRHEFKHSDWVASLEEEVTRGKETFLEHYKTKYNGFPRLPLWIACEIMSMGSLSHLYGGLLPDLQRRICSIVEIQQFVLVSWMHNITYMRNICAHHNRLWNRELSIKPFLPRKDKQWITLGLDNKHLFASVAIGEWICNKAELPIRNVEPVYEVMRKIAVMDTRFAHWMGVPANRAIGLCWVKK